MREVMRDKKIMEDLGDYAQDALIVDLKRYVIIILT